MSKLKSKSANHELRLSRLSYAESHTHVALEVSKPRQNIPMFLPITLWPRRMPLSERGRGQSLACHDLASASIGIKNLR